MSEVRDGRVDPFDGWLANSPMFLPKEHVVIRTDRALGPSGACRALVVCQRRRACNGREQVMVCRDDGQPFGSIGTEMVIGSRGERFFVDRS